MGCLPLGSFYVTNYGRRIQVNAMPSEVYTPQEQFALANTFNSAYWMNNLMALYNGNLAQMGVDQYAGAYQAGQQLGQQVSENIAINTSFNMLSGNITSLKTDLEQALKSDKLTDEQKATIKQQKQRAEELEKKLEDIKVLQQQGATTEQIKAALSQLSNEYRDLRDEVQAFADKIKQELEAGGTGETGETGETGGTGETGETGGTGGTGETVGTSKADYRKWADSLYQSGTDSFLGWGTDDDRFEDLIGQLNGSNVIELIDTFENRYGDFAIFVGSEAEHYQKKLVFRQILSALEDRAEIAGVSDEISEYVRQVNSELNKWVISKTNLNASIKNIVAVIKTKETENVQ